MTDAEITFAAAADYLDGRVNVLNRLTSAEIALSPDLLPAIRTQAFFSARVEEARILDALREVSDAYSRGDVDAATARLSLKSFLLGEAAAETDPDRAAMLRKLSSTGRLDLILTQNQMQAAAIGAREVAFDPDILERFPYYRYLPSIAGHPREDHEKFYNLVLPKEHPFWRTHTPPIDFRCRCGLDELTDEEAGEIGVGAAAETATAGDWRVTLPDGSVELVPRPASGYVFDIGAAFVGDDFGRVPENYRRHVMDAMTAHVRTGGRWIAYYAPGTASQPGAFHGEAELRRQLDALAPPTLALLRSSGLAPDALPDFNAVNAAIGDTHRKLPSELAAAWGGTVDLGTLRPEHSAAFGLDPADCQVNFSLGSRRLGLKHLWGNHKSELADPAEVEDIFRATLGNPGARVTVDLAPTKTGRVQRKLALDDPQTGAFLLLVEVPAEGARRAHYEVVSFMRADDEYRSEHWAVRYLREKSEGD